MKVYVYDKKFHRGLEVADKLLKPLEQMIVYGFIVWLISFFGALLIQEGVARDIFVSVNYASLIWTVACAFRRRGILEGLDLGADIMDVIAESEEEEDEKEN